MSDALPTFVTQSDVDSPEQRGRSIDGSGGELAVECEPNLAIVMPDLATTAVSQSAATVEVALDRLTRCDAVAALGVGIDDPAGRGAAAAHAWSTTRLQDNRRAWIFIADFDLRPRFGPAGSCSMVRLIGDNGVLLQLPKHRSSMINTAKTVDRMCEILDLIGLDSATVFCPQAQHRIVAARLRYRRVAAGFQSL